VLSLYPRHQLSLYQCLFRRLSASLDLRHLDQEDRKYGSMGLGLGKRRQSRRCVAGESPVQGRVSDPP